MNYYNDNDPEAVIGLRGLIAAGLIPPGEVDERSITDVRPNDLRGFIQCHFFAGVAGWPLALQLAGWPADRPVWSGSCPCQPFSCAGQGKGVADERHLWPAFFDLIRECRPDTLIGEQVANAIGKGWLDGISADLEGEGYAVGSCVFGAHSVGSPHIRNRLYWLAHANGEQELAANEIRLHAKSGGSRASERLANASSLSGAQRIREPGEGSRRETGPDDSAERQGLGGMADADDERNGSVENNAGGSGQPERCGTPDRMGNPDDPRPQGHDRHGDHRDEPGRINAEPHGSVGQTSGTAHRMGDADMHGREPGSQAAKSARHRDTTDPAGFWSDYAVIRCRDGKHRRIPAQSVFQLLVDGLPGGMGAVLDDCTKGFPLCSPEPFRVSKRKSIRPALLKGAGNAIVPEAAAQFIAAAMEILPTLKP